MSFDYFSFALKQKFEEFSGVDVVWAISAFLICFFVLGLFWGLLWNKKWGFDRLGTTILCGVCAVVIAFSLLAKRGADRAVSWLDVQRDQITEELTGSGALNRKIFKEAWVALQPLGGQDDLQPAPEGGQELRLRDRTEAALLAERAAAVVRSELLRQRPFAIGAPFSAKDPTVISAEVLESVPLTYPTLVSPSNELTRAAIAGQVDASIQFAASQVRTPMGELSKSLVILISIVLFIQFILVPYVAYKDIKENPKV
jgi:hypothetical protein